MKKVTPSKRFEDEMAGVGAFGNACLVVDFAVDEVFEYDDIEAQTSVCLMARSW